MKSPAQLLLSGEAGMEADSAFVAFSEDIYALFGDRRKVRPSEIAQAYEWVQDLGLRQETVLMLLSHCLSTRGAQFSFKLAEPEAVRMREANVVTAEDAEAFFAHSKKVHHRRNFLSRFLTPFCKLLVRHIIGLLTFFYQNTVIPKRYDATLP